MRCGSGLTWPLKVHLVCGGNVGAGAGGIHGRDGGRCCGTNCVVRDKLVWGIAPYHEVLRMRELRVNILHYCLSIQQTAHGDPTRCSYIWGVGIVPPVA